MLTIKSIQNIYDLVQIRTFTYINIYLGLINCKIINVIPDKLKNLFQSTLQLHFIYLNQPSRRFNSLFQMKSNTVSQAFHYIIQSLLLRQQLFV